MADLVDIAGQHDYSEEMLMARKREARVERGRCLFCDNPITEKVDGQLKLYCDIDCRKDYEHEQSTLSRQRNT